MAPIPPDREGGGEIKYACWQLHYLNRGRQLALNRNYKKSFAAQNLGGKWGGGGGVRPLRTPLNPSLLYSLNIFLNIHISIKIYSLQQ